MIYDHLFIFYFNLYCDDKVGMKLWNHFRYVFFKALPSIFVDLVSDKMPQMALGSDSWEILKEELILT